ncbi:hypothetical protein B0H15DRAFT_474460 [Mycena belliarum]|uniref:Uncharacterized protein n=1 Tax=Mycena belliarum TaxID=1033014 RepID=A0AAD6U0V8_9AGAR|nr:hypothetical protein B0H15DRAFT_474460 [Mycena belliae]
MRVLWSFFSSQFLLVAECAIKAHIRAAYIHVCGLTSGSFHIVVGSCLPALILSHRCLSPFFGTIWCIVSFTVNLFSLFCLPVGIRICYLSHLLPSSCGFGSSIPCEPGSCLLGAAMLSVCFLPGSTTIIYLLLLLLA